MPSIRNPATVVQPGPGRLPANTVPASALIFPPGSSSDAALQAHITDPVDAHMASAIGQTGYAVVNSTWVQAAAGVGGTQNALTTLFDAANARPTWVLDANPAAKGDFVGPNALINAVAAAGANYPVLYLRQGTYNWTDPSIISYFSIIGARSDTTIINGTGNLRLGAYATLKNLKVVLPGNLNVLGGFGLGFNKVEDVIFDATGSLLVPSAFNTFERISGADQVMSVTGAGNVIKSYLNITISLGSNALNTAISEGVVLSSVRTLTNPVLQIASSGNKISNIFVQDLTSFNAPCFQILGTASNNILEDLTVQDLTTPGVNFEAIQVVNGTSGTHINGVQIANFNGVALTGFQHALVRLFGNDSSFSDCKVTAVDNLAVPTVLLGANNNSVHDVSVVGNAGCSASVFSCVGSYSVYSNLSVKDFTTPSGLFKAFEFTGFNCRAEGITVDNCPQVSSLIVFNDSNSSYSTVTVTNISTLSANILVYIGSSALVIDGLSISNLTTIPAGFRALYSDGRDVKINDLNISSIGNASLMTLPLVHIQGDFALDTVRLGGCGTLAIPMPQPALHFQSASGSIRGVVTNQDIFSPTTYSSVSLLKLEAFCIVDVTDCVFRSLYFDCPAVDIAVLPFAFGIVYQPQVKFTNCVIESLVYAIPNTVPALRIVDSTGVKFDNCRIYAGGGKACGTTNSGAVFEDCTFVGGDSLAAAGNQLFYGWGAKASGFSQEMSLVLRNCIMEFGDSNCNPTVVTSPIVFFGGSGSTPFVGHGAIHVDGLHLSPAPATSITNWHLASTLVVDVKNQDATVVSSYSHITIDLANIPWSASGTGSSVYGSITTDGTVLEIEGPTSYADNRQVLTKFDGVSITRAQLSVAGTGRSLIKAVACTIDNLVLDGPSVALAAGFFNTPLALLSAVQVNGLDLFPSAALKSGTDPIVQALFSTIERAVVRNLNNATSLCVFEIGGSTLKDSTLDISGPSFVYATQLLIVSTGFSHIQNNSINVSNRETYNQFINLSGLGGDVVEDNLIISSGGTTEFVYGLSTSFHTIANNEFITQQGAAVHSDTGASMTLGAGTKRILDASVNFITLGVQPGDLFQITAASAGISIGNYKVTTVVDATHIDLDRTPNPGANSSGIAWTVYTGGCAAVQIKLEQSTFNKIHNNTLTMIYSGQLTLPILPNIYVLGDDAGFYGYTSISSNTIVDYHPPSLQATDPNGRAFIYLFAALGNTVTGNVLSALSISVGPGNPGGSSIYLQGGGVIGGQNIATGNSLTNFIGGGEPSIVSSLGFNAASNVFTVGASPLNVLLP